MAKKSIWMDPTPGRTYLRPGAPLTSTYWYGAKLHVSCTPHDILDNFSDLKGVIVEFFGEKYEDRCAVTTSPYGNAVYFKEVSDMNLVYLSIKDWENEK